MARAIYIPRDEGLAGVGNMLAGAIDAYAQRQELERIKEFQSAIERTSNRQEALDIFNKIPFKTIDQMNMGRQWLNTVHPPKDTTPKEVSTFDPETGKETKQFVQSGDLASFSKSATEAGQSLTKPEVADFYKYQPDGTFQAIGKHPLTNRPEGANTLEELKMIEQQRTDKLKMEAADRAERRFQAQMDKLAEIGSKEQATKTITELKAYNGVVASMLNIKKSIGQNGEIILDFGGDSKVADAYRTALENGKDYMKKYHGDINKAAKAALKDAGAFERPAPEAPTAPSQPQGGLLTNFIKSLTSSKHTPAESKTATPARTIVRTGTKDGKKVVQYSDGTVEYADK